MDIIVTVITTATTTVIVIIKGEWTGETFMRYNWQSLAIS